MKRMLVYAFVAFMTTSSLFGMEAEVNSLAKAAAEAAEKARAGTNPVTRRIPTAEELATAERLQAPQTQLLMALNKEIEAVNILDKNEERLKNTIVSLRAYLAKPQLEAYIPLALATIIKHYEYYLRPFGSAAAVVAELDLPNVNKFFLQNLALASDYTLRDKTDAWIRDQLEKWYSKGDSDLKPGEQKLLRDLLFGINTSTEHIPAFMKANDPLLFDKAQAIIRREEFKPNNSLLTFLITTGLVDANMPGHDRDLSLMQRALTQAVPKPFNSYPSAPYTLPLIKQILKAGGKVLENNETDANILKLLTLSNDTGSVAVLRTLLEENETNNNVQINIPVPITELNNPTLKYAKELPPLPAALKDAKMKLLQEYLQRKYTIIYKLQTLWGSKK